MRRDGDALVEHIALATQSVVLCAPFIKAPVLAAILARLKPAVAVEVVTRWNAAEVAAGVSDLEVFDIVQRRPNTTLRLIDNLHAKIFLADDKVLTGSTNITARAFGWCAAPNLEVLVPASIEEPTIQTCLAAIAQARVATDIERSKVQAEAEATPTRLLPEAKELEIVPTGAWLPRLGAPHRLYAAYLPATRNRLTADSLEAANYDLAALGLPEGLDEAAFGKAVRRAMSNMPAVRRLLQAAEQELDDAGGLALVRVLDPESDLDPAAQWAIVREWLTYFMGETYEIAPQMFIVRPRTTTKR